MYKIIPVALMTIVVILAFIIWSPSLVKRRVVSERIVDAVIIKIEEDMNPNFFLTVTFNGIVSRVDAVGHFKVGEKIKACLVEEQSQYKDTNKYWLTRNWNYCDNKT